MLTGLALAGSRGARPNSLVKGEVPHYCIPTASSLIRSISDNDGNRAEYVLRAHDEYSKGLRGQRIDKRRSEKDARRRLRDGEEDKEAVHVEIKRVAVKQGC